MLDGAGAVQDRADLGDDLVEMPFSGLVAGQQCDCDINFSQVIITPERDKVVDFTKSYFDANQSVLAKAGIKMASVDDAKKLQWGAQLNTIGASFLADKIQPDKETRIFDKTVDVFAALNAGQIDAIMFDTPIVLGAVEEKQVKDAEVVGQFKTGEIYGAVVNRGSRGRFTRPPRWLVIGYIDLFRAIPGIVPIYMIGFGIPIAGVPWLST